MYFNIIKKNKTIMKKQKEQEKPIFYLYGEIPIYKKDCHPDFLEYNPCENSVRSDGTIYITEGLCINYEGEFEEDIY